MHFCSRFGFTLAVTLIACANTPNPPSEAPRAAEGAAPARASAAPLAPAPIESKGAGYELTRGSVRLLGTVKGRIHIDAYVTRGFPTLDAFARDLEALLREYERSAGGKLSFTLIEATTGELRDRAKEAGLQEQPLAEGSRGRDPIMVANGYLGLVFAYGSERAIIPVLNPSFGQGVEFWVSNKIREIRDKVEGIRNRIGVVAKKGELDLRGDTLTLNADKKPSLVSIMEQAFPFYTIEPVDLKGGAASIDEHLVGLIVTQPGTTYGENELRRIDEFLMRGKKSLTVYASAVTLKRHDASMKATLDTHGLERLLEGYGIRMNRDAVFDLASSFRVRVGTASGEVVLRHPGIVSVANSRVMGDRPFDTAFVPFFRMDELHFPFASSLTLLPNKQPADVTVRAVARTTPEAWVETGTSLDMRIREKYSPRPPLESRTIAAVAEGRLVSAFASSSSARAAESSRLFVVASSEFLANPFVYASGGSKALDETLEALSNAYLKNLTSTILSFKNTLDWMASDEDLVEASSRLIGRPPQ